MDVENQSSNNSNAGSSDESDRDVETEADRQFIVDDDFEEEEEAVDRQRKRKRRKKSRKVVDEEEEFDEGDYDVIEENTGQTIRPGRNVRCPSLDPEAVETHEGRRRAGDGAVRLD